MRLRLRAKQNIIKENMCVEGGDDRQCKLRNKSDFRTSPVLTAAQIHVKSISDSIN